MISVTEGRVLGTLIEKEATTPDQYPLSANALVLGCNQSTNRDPIMHVDVPEVDDAIRTLKEQHLARVVHPTHGRGVTKYRHVVGESLGLDAEELAVLGVLLLRGPQTNGELRTRTERLHPFASVDEVDDALGRLAARAEPLAMRLERQPGQKEARWVQLLAEESASHDASPGNGRSAAGEREPGLRDRVEQLETRVLRLETALADLLGEA
ncbi:MAG: YceH family protein [Acidimicrobiia bacterium]